MLSRSSHSNTCRVQPLPAKLTHSAFLPIKPSASMSQVTSLPPPPSEPDDESANLDISPSFPSASPHTISPFASTGALPELIPLEVTRTTRTDDEAAHRRRRDVRAARDRLGEQFEQLRKVLPEPKNGVELSAKAQVLEQTLEIIQRLMKRVNQLSMELAVVSPEATRRWVRHHADDGRNPLVHTVSCVMKLFAARREWRYAEWWTLDERQDDGSEDGEGGEIWHETKQGVMDDPANLHGCVVRDSVSVMRLAWVLIQREGVGVSESDEELGKFARASAGFEFKPRVGMPGRVWTSRRAEWLINLEDQETFIRGALAEEFGMKTCLAVPVRFGGHVHSIMAFYSTGLRTYDAECYDLACLLAKCVEEIYAPSNGGPWQIQSANLFPGK